jgi:cytochrome P450
MDTSIVAWRRKTTAPVEIANTPIPENATLLLLLGSANHDPAVFEHPETLIFTVKTPEIICRLAMVRTTAWALPSPVWRRESCLKRLARNYLPCG